LIYFNLFVVKIYFQGLNSSEKIKESLKKIIVFPVVSPHFSCYTVYKNHRILTRKQIVTVHSRVNSNNRYGCLGHPKGLLMHNTIRYFSLLSFGSDVFFMILSVFFHYFI